METISKISNDNDEKEAQKVSCKKIEKPTKIKTPKMEQLLQGASVKIPGPGELIKGKVVTTTNSAVYEDLGVLGTGIIMGREMKDGLGIIEGLNEGDEIEATVVETENDDGYMELSIREAAYERAWSELRRKMEEKETVNTRILEAKRGGLMVEINGIYGFLPVSQLSHEHYPRVEDGDKNKILQLLLRLVGQEIKVKIIDVDAEEEKLIVSEKATYEEKERAIIGEFAVGDIVSGVVSGVVNFGAFVKFAPKGKKVEEVDDKQLLEGLVHISEIAWQLIDDPNSVVKTGEKVQCKIIDIDGTRVSLSIRALLKDPWTKIYNKYQVGKVVRGEVTKLNPFGAFIQLDSDIHGLAHVSEVLSKIKARSITDVLETGKKYAFKILSIEPESHRLGLTLATDEDQKSQKEAAPDKAKKGKRPLAKEKKAIKPSERKKTAKEKEEAFPKETAKNEDNEGKSPVKKEEK